MPNFSLSASMKMTFVFISDKAGQLLGGLS